MGRHPDTISTLAVTLDVETKLFHCFVIKFEPIFALIKAVVDAVRTYPATVFTIAYAKFVFVFLVSFALFVCLDVNDGIECGLQRLAILSVPSLEVNSVLSLAKRCKHKFRRRAAKGGSWRVTITDHCILIDPQNRP